MKLIALDLDGTTLNSNKIVTDETLHAIRKAQQKGHIVMILSGRAPKSIYDELAKYDLHCPVGASNGTALFVDGQLLKLTSLTATQSLKIASEIEKEYMPYNITTNKGSFGLKDWQERFNRVLHSGRVPEEYYENKHFKMFTTPPWEYGHSLIDHYGDILNDEEIKVQKFQILGLDPEQKQRLYKNLQSIEDIYITSSSPFNIEVNHINGNKGNGLKMMAEHFQIPLENTVAIGDERNDIPMFQTAGLSIAMGNAEAEIKSYCNSVTLTNDENGVAHAIEKFVLTD